MSSGHTDCNDAIAESRLGHDRGRDVVLSHLAGVDLPLLGAQIGRSLDATALKCL